MEGIKSIKEILSVLKKRLLLIVLVSFGAGVVSGLFTYFTVTPLYQTSAQLLVNKNTKGDKVYDDVSELNVQSNLDLIDTYSVIIRNPVILKEVVERLNLPYSAEQLSQQIQVSKQDATQVVNITATDTDPERAAQIVDTTINVFLEKLPKLMKVNNVQVMNEAVPVFDPISPNISRNIVLAIALGAILGVGLVLLFEFLDTTVRTKSDLEKLEIKVVGSLSNITDKERMPQSFVESLRTERRSFNAATSKTEG